MKKVVFMVFGIFALLWAILALYLTGYISSEILPNNLEKLTPPTTTTELGDSLSILDGVFASIAIVLGLIAILYQGKELKIQGEELKNSAIAQKEQVEAMVTQTEQQKTTNALQSYQQEMSNKLAGYTARLQHAQFQEDSLNKKIEWMYADINTNKSKHKEGTLLKVIEQKEYYSEKAIEYDSHIGTLLQSFSMKPDFGIFLLNSGMRNVEQIFYDLAIDHLSIIDQNTITSIFNYTFQEKEFAVSLSLDVTKLYIDLIESMPKSLQKRTREWINDKKNKTFEFGNPITINYISAMPGKEQEDEYGKRFIPLVVQKIT